MYAVINFYKIQHVSFSDQGPLLETLEFFEISQGSDQPLDLLLYKILAHTCSVGDSVEIVHRMLSNIKPFCFLFRSRPCLYFVVSSRDVISAAVFVVVVDVVVGNAGQSVSKISKIFLRMKKTMAPLRPSPLVVPPLSMTTKIVRPPSFSSRLHLLILKNHVKVNRALMGLARVRWRGS